MPATNDDWPEVSTRVTATNFFRNEDIVACILIQLYSFVNSFVSALVSVENIHSFRLTCCG